MLLLVLALLTPSAAADHSGTVKISGDQGEAEPDPDNEPHVSCQFAVEFFQFAVEEVQVTFTAQAPSGDETIIILTDTVALEENEGGDEPTYNGQAAYDFTGLLDDLERHPEQGYHVKLSVDQSPAEPPLKHKVFWVDCPPPDDAAEADLTVEKAVTGGDAPASDTLFEITITCDGDTEVITLADGDTWTWNANADPDLTEDSTCSIEETDDHDATTVTVTSNGTEIDQGSDQDLSEGTNTVTVTNDFDDEFIEVGGGEIPGEEDVQTEPGDEVEVLGRSFEQPTSEPEVEVKGVTLEQLPRTGASPWALLLLAMTLISTGIVTLRRTASGRVR